MKQYLADNEELMKEWDWEANQGLNPKEITRGSHKKVWWECPKCGHKWQTETRNRAILKRGCPCCVNRVVVVGKNDLATTHPDLAKEWHSTKNSFRPTNFTAGSGKMVWWKCSKCGYEWKTKIENRGLLKRGCPHCANKVIIPGKNDLQTTHPALSKEWHWLKNAPLTPQHITFGSRKKVWWKCPLGHEYQSSVSNRIHGTNCPICNNGRQTSFTEQAIFYYIKKMYSDAISRYKADFLGLMELDIYIPSQNIAIEYDGKPWHSKGVKGKYEREQRKFKICQNNHIELVRIREDDTVLDKNIANHQIHINKVNNYDNVKKTITQLLEYIGKPKNSINIDINIERDRFIILEMVNIFYKNGSLEELFPNIAKEWHPTKNGNLSPKMFKPQSKTKVWWKCSNCGTEYEMSIMHKVRSKTAYCKRCNSVINAKKKGKKVSMIDIDTGQVIEIFSSLHDAANKMHLTVSNICMVCNGQRNKAGGYIWKYVD